MNSPITNITKIDTVPHVDVVMSTPQGGLLAISGGESTIIPSMLLVCSCEDGEPPVKLVNDNVLFPGQTIYSATREYVSSIVGTFSWLSWKDRLSFLQNIPTDSVFHFVLTY